MHGAFIFKCVVVSKGFFRLIAFSSFSPFFFLICFLQSGGGLEHDLFFCPFVSLCGVHFFGLNLGFPMYPFFSPFVGCFCVMEFVGFSSSIRGFP